MEEGAEEGLDGMTEDQQEIELRQRGQVKGGGTAWAGRTRDYGQWEAGLGWEWLVE